MAMRLRELEPHFARWEASDPNSYRRVRSLKRANGVFFLCPKCFVANDGAIGTHGILCWSPEVPLVIEPGPGRWPMTGTSLADLTLSPSVNLDVPNAKGESSGCKWHGFIENGNVRDA